MTAKGKNFWILLIFLLCGLVIGGLIGTITAGINYLEWLSYGESFGLTSPLVLDLSILSLSFGFTVKINIASIIGISIAIFIYRKSF